MDVMRPQNRFDIILAMRRIRFEFKSKAVKKERIYFKISTEGVFVNLRTVKKTPIILRLSHSFNLLNVIQSEHYAAASKSGLLLMQHPIYRIFYVSHDSQDLKIFSYIAKDIKSKTFKCNVFKALTKTDAIKIVRTIGQAFDVFHQFNQCRAHNRSSVKKENKILHIPQLKIITSSQSAQPIRSTDIVKSYNDPQSDCHSESLTTLDDLLNQTLNNKEKKRTFSNSISEPNMKSQSHKKKINFDNGFSSHLFFNEFITKQDVEFNTNISQELRKSEESEETLLKKSPDQNAIYSSTSKFEQLKRELENEIKLRSKCQNQLDILVYQNKLLTSFIKRTFEEIRLNECNSCMLRLPTLDMYRNLNSIQNDHHQTFVSAGNVNQVLEQNTRIQIPIVPSISTEKLFENIHLETKLLIRRNTLINQSEKYNQKENFNFNRKLNNSSNQSFDNATVWSSHCKEGYQLDFKEQKKSNHSSQCTSETSISISQDETNEIPDSTGSW